MFVHDGFQPADAELMQRSHISDCYRAVQDQVALVKEVDIIIVSHGGSRVPRFPITVGIVADTMILGSRKTMSLSSLARPRA